MAGAAVSPGDSIPPRLTNPCTLRWDLDDEIVPVIHARGLAGGVAVGAQPGKEAK